MILVLLGTQNNSFHRLLKEIENCIDNKIINEDVMVQAGYTKYSSDKMEIFDFISANKFNELLQRANLIITHGGVGSITSSIKIGKKVIAIPRLKEFNEHVNNHQIQIIESFDHLGYIKAIYNVNELENAIKNIDSFTPNKYISNNQNILKIITNYIDNN